MAESTTLWKRNPETLIHIMRQQGPLDCGEKLCSTTLDKHLEPSSRFQAGLPHRPTQLLMDGLTKCDGNKSFENSNHPKTAQTEPQEAAEVTGPLGTSG